MTAITFFTDANNVDKPASVNRRVVLQHEIARLKSLHWCDPSDADLLDIIMALKDELHALDRGSAS
jgi:hypothetical protein